MELLLLALVGGALYLYHETTSGGAASGGSGINIQIKNSAGGSSDPKASQQQKPSQGFGGGGGGLGGGGASAPKASGAPASYQDPVSTSFLGNSPDDRQTNAYEDQWLARETDQESVYESQQGYWDEGNQGPVSPGYFSGAPDDLPFSDEIDPGTGFDSGDW